MRYIWSWWPYKHDNNIMTTTLWQQQTTQDKISFKIYWRFLLMLSIFSLVSCPMVGGKKRMLFSLISSSVSPSRVCRPYRIKERDRKWSPVHCTQYLIFFLYCGRHWKSCTFKNDKTTRRPTLTYTVPYTVLYTVPYTGVIAVSNNKQINEDTIKASGVTQYHPLMYHACLTTES